MSQALTAQSCCPIKEPTLLKDARKSLPAGTGQEVPVGLGRSLPLAEQYPRLSTILVGSSSGAAPQSRARSAHTTRVCREAAGVGTVAHVELRRGWSRALAVLAMNPMVLSSVFSVHLRPDSARTPQAQ